MRHRFGVAACIAVCAASLFGIAATADDAEPTFRVENSRLELEPVTAGATAVATFVFHNGGDREVKLLRAAPS